LQTPSFLHTIAYFILCIVDKAYVLLLYTVAETNGWAVLDFIWFCGKQKVWEVTMKEGTMFREEENSEKQNLANFEWCKVPFQAICYRIYCTH